MKKADQLQILTVDSNQDYQQLTLKKCYDYLLDKEVSKLPIVDKSRKLLGLVTRFSYNSVLKYSRAVSSGAHPNLTKFDSKLAVSIEIQTKNYKSIQEILSKIKTFLDLGCDHFLINSDKNPANQNFFELLKAISVQFIQKHGPNIKITVGTVKTVEQARYFMGLGISSFLVEGDCLKICKIRSLGSGLNIMVKSEHSETDTEKSNFNYLCSGANHIIKDISNPQSTSERIIYNDYKSYHYRRYKLYEVDRFEEQFSLLDKNLEELKEEFVNVNTKNVEELHGGVSSGVIRFE